jgi:hypothetical protein
MSAALTKAPIKSAINPKLEPANVPTKLALPWGNAANQVQKALHINETPVPMDF